MRTSFCPVRTTIGERSTDSGTATGSTSTLGGPPVAGNGAGEAASV